jgi:hypothetical protein
MKKLTALFLAFSILVSSNFIASSSHAAVGLIFKSRVVKTIGGIGSAGGLTLLGVSVIVGKTTKTFSGLLYALVGIYYGVILGGVGLIVLDDQTVADIEFMPLTAERAPQFDQGQLNIYNAELAELNAIRKTIQAETADSEALEDAAKLWNQYKAYLSPETVEIAEFQARQFLLELQRAL